LCTSSSVSGRDTLAGRPTRRDRGGYVLPIATSAPAATATSMAPGGGGGGATVVAVDAGMRLVAPERGAGHLDRLSLEPHTHRWSRRQ
jgi:hypothetical protein